EGLREHRHERQHQEERQEQDRKRDDNPAHEAWLLPDVVRVRRSLAFLAWLQRAEGDRHDLSLACPHNRPERSSDHRGKRLTASRIRKAAISINTAMAVASAYLNSSSRITIRRGAISDTLGRLPAMKITEPYSPTARAKASAKPVSNAGSTAGR